MFETIIEPGVVHTLGHLQYIKNSLPPFTQLRFISGTSLNHQFGVISIVYDKQTDAVLVIPYYLKKSHEQTEKIDIPESPESLGLRLITKEATLKSQRLNVLGSPLEKNDRRFKGRKFKKYVVLITDFSSEDRFTIEKNSNKNGNPFWVKRELLSYIFEEEVLIDEVIKKHPHTEAFNRFIEFFPEWDQLEKW